MSEENTISEIFDEKWTAKSGNKYLVKWCYLCDCAIISHEECTGTTCNCHSCKKCQGDFKEFGEYRNHIEHYLTEEEIKIYQKSQYIKKHILESIPKGIKKIDWVELDKNGGLSRNERKIFIK